MVRGDTAFLDAFRVLAVAWVVLGHCLIWSGVKATPFSDPKMAVDLFFVISGFLMVYIMDRGLSLGQFYGRRLLRIAPAYYVAVAAAVILAPLTDAGYRALPGPEAGVADLSPTSILAHLSFLHGFSPSYAASLPLPDWSIAVEMQFYLLFPALYVIGRRGSMILTCTGLAVLSIAAVRLHPFPVYPEPSLLVFKLPLFMVGMLIYEARAKPACLVPAFLLLCFAASVYWWPGIVVIGLVSLLAFFWLAGVPHGLQPLFASQAVRHLAAISYPMFLCHGFVLAILGPLVLDATSSVALMTLFVFAASYPISRLLHAHVEEPMRRLRLRPRKAAVAPA